MKNLHRRTKEEILEYCINDLGHDAESLTESTRDQLIALVQQAQGTHEPMAPVHGGTNGGGVEEEDHPDAVSADAKVDGYKEGDHGKRVAITIFEQDGDGGDQPVPVGVNGRVYVIKRGVRVMVPRAVVNVLNDAVVTQMEHTGSGEHKERQYRRFSLQVG